LSRAFDYSITIACGEFISDVHDIEYAVTSSLVLADYGRLLGNNAGFMDQEIQAGLREALFKKYPQFLLENHHRALINAIFRRDFTQAEFIVNCFIITHFSYHLVNFMLLRDRLQNNILFLVISLVMKNVHIFHEQDMRFNKIWDRIKNSVKLEEMQLAVSDFFVLISDFVKQMKECSINYQRMQPVIDYMRENFANPMISETQICEKFNISVSNLSHFFKEQMNISFVSYLQTLRIEKAKQLMTSSSDSIDAIAREIGYSSGESLLKLFKRIEGISPSQYRRNVTVK
jgi:two-component system response regulator YesN